MQGDTEGHKIMQGNPLPISRPAGHCFLPPQTWTAQTGRDSVMAAPPKPLSVDIHTSVKEGDMAKVFEFLEEGGDVNVRCRCATILLLYVVM